MGNPVGEEDPYWELEVYLEKTQQEINKLVSSELHNGSHGYRDQSSDCKMPSSSSDSWTDNIFAGLRSVVERQLSEIELDSLPPYLPPTPPHHKTDKDLMTSRGEIRQVNKKAFPKFPVDGNDALNFHSRHKYFKDPSLDGSNHNAVDATTQTTPYNLSRSSSFTWITGGDSSTLLLSGSSASIVSSSPSEASIVDGGFLDDTSISLSDTVSVREDPEESGIGTSSPKPSRHHPVDLLLDKVRIKEISLIKRREMEEKLKDRPGVKEDVWTVQDFDNVIELKPQPFPATSLPTTPSEEGWNNKLDNFGILSTSAPVLEGREAMKQMETPARCHSAKAITEVEAVEACSWLKAAGFPQYAQMYEDMKFPVDLGTVQRDHPFLDGDSMCALFRRLKVLNQCAQLRLGPPVSGLESDEDDDCALSENWSLDRTSRRWSRTPGHLDDQSNPILKSSSSRRPDEPVIPNGSPKLPRGSTSLKGGFMKRMGSLRRRGKTSAEDSSFSPPLPSGNRHDRSPSASSRNIFNRKSTSKRPPLAATKNGRHSATDIRRIEIEDDKLNDSNLQVIYNEGYERPQSSNESLASGSLNMTSTSSSMTSASNEDNSHQRSISPWAVVQGKDSTLTPMRHPVPIASLCCSQLQLLRKWALLHLTSVLERYCPSNKSFKHWDLPKFLRKMKAPDYKDRVVFGVPFTVIAQRTGLPLPSRVLHAMKFIKTVGMEQVGIFRKSGVRSRIQKLRMMWEADTDVISLDESQAYDVADLIKQYFRDVPQGLLNAKFSDTLVAIFQYLPSKLRRDALLATLLMLPDEHREVLHTLMKFLADIAELSSVNQMTPSNLAVCFAPSLFHTGPSRSASSSPRRKRAVGTPGPRELNENKAAHECLTLLIQECDSIFKVPMDVWMHCKYSYLDVIEWETLKKNTINDQKTWERYIQETVKLFHKEARESPRRWISTPCRDTAIELYYKKVEDGHPLRLWQITTEVEAPPSEVLFRILRERWMWDWSLIQGQILDTLSPTADIYQYTTASVPGEPFRDYCVLRFWEVNLQGPCTLVETSVDYPKASLSQQGVRGVVLASRYLIEPCGGGRSRIIHFSRIDTMGRSREWYNKIYGHILALKISRIRESFCLYETIGPESKV